VAALIATILLAASAASAEDVRVMTSGGFTAPVLEVAPAFERTAKTTVATAFGASTGRAPDSRPMKLQRDEPAARSRDRMPPIPADSMTDEQKQAVAEFKAARGVDLTGPFFALLRSPEVLNRARAMGDYLRFKTSLPPRLSEFVILMTSRSWSQQYEWNVHYPIALKAGLTPDVAAAVAEGRRPSRMTTEEALLYDFHDELSRTQAVSDATYARMVSMFGEKGVVDTVGIVGYYTMLAMMLNTAHTPVPDNGIAPLPPLSR
jgi:4-carboxymuconolactone decarboxylase